MTRKQRAYYRLRIDLSVGAAVYAAALKWSRANRYTYERDGDYAHMVADYLMRDVVEDVDLDDAELDKVEV